MKVRRKGRRSKQTTPADYTAQNWKVLECSNGCGRTERVTEDVESVLCGMCSCQLAGPTDVMLAQAERRKAKESGIPGIKRPRGWQFMKEFVDAAGNVFHRQDYINDKGKKAHRTIEMPELKGTKPPTVVVVKPKLSKREKEERKQAKLKKRYEKMKRQQKQAENSKKFFKDVTHA